MPKIVDHDAYRNELLQKYFDDFAQRGYNDVTMREIAQSLGVSTGSLYHYFPTKNSILESMMQLASRRDISGAVENKGGDWEQEFINYLSNVAQYCSILSRKDLIE